MMDYHISETKYQLRAVFFLEQRKRAACYFIKKKKQKAGKDRPKYNNTTRPTKEQN